jgi:acyl-CoA synthetase (AMP-forming)/AMP-acid ligase II
VNTGCCLYNEQTEQIIAVYSGEMEEKPLLRSLKEKLPKYMLPNVFIRRAQLPQTGNGKIDRVQLKKEIIG